jgi:hypothetical protein
MPATSAPSGPEAGAPRAARSPPAGAAPSGKSSAGAMAEGATVELLLPVNDAAGGLATGAASAAAFLSRCGIPEPQRLGSCISPLLGSGLLRLGWSGPFRHLRSASVVVAQLCPCRKSINQHANATERRGHLRLKRRRSFERSAVFTSGW